MGEHEQDAGIERPARPEGTLQNSSRARHARVTELFDDVRALPVGERAAYIAAHADDDVRERVERLLAHDTGAAGVSRAAGAFLAGAASSLADDRILAAVERGAEPRVGNYRLLRLLGAGGMGAVFEAEQDNPQRRVALKVVSGALARPELRRRFELEARVLGRLSHPGIAHVHEAGVADFPELGERPYFAMELVDGLPLLEHCRRHELDTRARLELLARVCDAVEHAHRKGVVHRDLKPDNVLVQPGGQPKVLDFGVARATDADLRTETLQTTAGGILGTVPSMSPEQVAGRSEQIDARSDVYSLGVLAYELVSERRPYRLERLALPEAARVIQEEEPSQLGTLGTQWRGDVETIAGKALEKDPGRRYQSAAGMAADIRRYLRDEPIAARPPSALYQVTKFARRNKAIVAGVAGVVVALAAGTVVSLRFAMREAAQHALADESAALAEQSAELASERERDALRQAYRASLAAAQAALRDGEISASDLLDAAPPALRGWAWDVLQRQLDESVRTLRPPGPGVVGCELSADGVLRSVRGSGGPDDLRILVAQDAQTGAVLRSAVLAPERPVRVRPEELALARRLAVFLPGETELEYRDVETGALLARDRRCGDGTAREEVISRAGDVAFLSGPGSEARDVCDLSTGRPISTLPVAPLRGGSGGVLSDDGGLLAFGLARTLVRVFDVATGAHLSTLDDGRDDVDALRFVGAGGLLATVSWNGILRLWDARSGELRGKHRLGPTRLRHVVASRDGARLAVIGNDGLVRIWDVAEGRETLLLHGRSGTLLDAAFGPDGRLLATIGQEAVQLWDVSDDGDMSVLRGHESYVYPVLFSPDGARIYSAGWDSTVRVWDAETREAVATLRTPMLGDYIRALAISPDGRRVIAETLRRLHSFDTQTGRLLGSRRGGGWMRWSAGGELHVWLDGPDGATRTVRLDPDSLEVLEDPAADSEPPWALSPDGAWLACAAAAGEIEVRPAGGGCAASGLADLPPRLLAWSPNSQALAASSERDIHAWHAPASARLVRKDVHQRRVGTLAFSPDDRLLASGGGDDVVRVFDAETLEPLLQLRGHDAYVWQVAWSPDGAMLASSSGDTKVRVWDSVPLGERWQAREERRRDVAALRPVVNELFSDLGDAALVLDAVRARTAGGSARYRRAALDVVLQVSAGRPEGAAQ